jgi:hypothetical protein
MWAYSILRILKPNPPRRCEKKVPDSRLGLFTPAIQKYHHQNDQPKDDISGRGGHLYDAQAAVQQANDDHAGGDSGQEVRFAQLVEAPARVPGDEQPRQGVQHRAQDKRAHDKGYGKRA